MHNNNTPSAPWYVTHPKCAKCTGMLYMKRLDAADGTHDATHQMWVGYTHGSVHMGRVYSAVACERLDAADCAHQGFGFRV